MTTDTKTRSDLKAYFVKNAIPTEENFAELIDGQINQADDGVFKVGDDPLSIAIGSSKQRQVLRFYEHEQSTPAWALSLANDMETPGFGIDDPHGKTRLFINPGGRVEVPGGLAVSGGGNRDGATMGLWLHNAKDDTMVIYGTAREGKGKSPGGGNPASGHFDKKDDWRMRFRCQGGKEEPVGQGFLFENTSEEALVDISGDTGDLWTRGSITVAGNVSAASVTASGNVNAATVTASGNVNAATVTASGHVKAGGFRFDTIIEEHIEVDGALYRWDGGKGGDVWMTVDNHFYMRHTNAKKNESSLHFDTQNGHLELTSVTASGNVSANEVKIGEYSLAIEDGNLYIKHGGNYLVQFSNGENRFQIHADKEKHGKYWHWKGGDNPRAGKTW